MNEDGPKWIKHPDGYWYSDMTGGTLHLGKKDGATQIVFTTEPWLYSVPSLGINE